jgi:Domain of unknown function (DUF5667)
MKKVFSIFSLLLVLLVLSSSLSFAKTDDMSPSPTMAMQKMDSMKMEKNDYLLAYPGMLPDNPLYKLKVLRDKIMAALITDPQKKVDYDLLQTDKQIGMALQLAEKKEIDLAKTTALKAENNFTQLVFVYRTNSTKPDAKTFQKLEKAAGKHQEVLQSIMKKVSSDDAKTFQQVINFSQTNKDSLEKIFNGDGQ